MCGLPSLPHSSSSQKGCSFHLCEGSAWHGLGTGAQQTILGKKKKKGRRRYLSLWCSHNHKWANVVCGLYPGESRRENACAHSRASVLCSSPGTFPATHLVRPRQHPPVTDRETEVSAACPGPTAAHPSPAQSLSLPGCEPQGHVTGCGCAVAGENPLCRDHGALCWCQAVPS